MVEQYAVVQNGIVTNITLAESALAENWIQSSAAKIGDSYADGVFTSPAPAPQDIKIIGVSILGVMCSATKDDQAGLSAVALGVTLARMAGQAFPDTKFEFENGSSLVITDANFDSVYSAWTPFRQSFFTP